MRGSLPLRALVACVALAASGCSIDTAVFVTGDLASVSVEVQSSALGAALGGGFDLELYLGERASGPSTITLDAFRLTTVGGDALVDPLPLSTPLTFPLTVEPTVGVTVPFVIDPGPDLISTAERDALCAAGQVVVRGSFRDSLQTASTLVVSDPVPPSCP
jgi:hypothetical protein